MMDELSIITLLHAQVCSMSLHVPFKSKSDCQTWSNGVILLKFCFYPIQIDDELIPLRNKAHFKNQMILKLFSPEFF